MPRRAHKPVLAWCPKQLPAPENDKVVGLSEPGQPSKPAIEPAEPKVTAPCGFRVGDEVFSEQHDAFGCVRQVEDASALVEFPALDDLSCIPFSDLRVTAREGFHLGQRVVWRSADHEIPRGTVGFVHAFRDNGDLSVRFEDRRFAFPMESILDVGPACGFEAGDLVRWSDWDNDVPLGCIGTVLGIRPIVNTVFVEFMDLDRVFGFSATQLVMVKSKDGSDHSVRESTPVYTSNDSCRRPPCYPFFGNHTLEFSRGEVVLNLTKSVLVPPIGLVVFCPGTHGGVGPCRTPGTNYDPQALFPTLVNTMKAQGVFCCQVCWSAMHPDLSEAVQGTVLAVHHAIRELRDQCLEDYKLGVCLVGHSLGGAVVLGAARVLKDILANMQDELPGRLLAVCTLAAQHRGAEEFVRDLAGIGKLFLHGSADAVLPVEIVKTIHGAAPHPKQFKIFDGCEHDFYTFKSQVLSLVQDFLLKAFKSHRDWMSARSGKGQRRGRHRTAGQVKRWRVKARTSENED